MKKDFSQDFSTSPAFIHIIIKDLVSSKYLLYIPDDPQEQDFCDLLSFELDPSRSLAIQLSEYLFGLGMVLNSYREISNQHDVTFSLTDSTPGTLGTSTCLHAIVNIRDIGIQPWINDNREISHGSLLNLGQLLTMLQASPYYADVVGTGLTQLINESNLSKN